MFLDTRSLFERSLNSILPEKARGIWKMFLDYENKYGDLASIQKIEKRIAEAYPNGKSKQPTIELFALTRKTAPVDLLSQR
jgi:hypothetical protein